MVPTRRAFADGYDHVPILIGLAATLTVALLARIIGMDRDRALYPIALVFIAAYYLLFAVIGGSQSELWIEFLFFLMFVGMAFVGFRSSLWLVVGGLAAHGLFDVFHHYVVAGRGVPSWWPGFCLGADVAAAACLAALLILRPTSGPTVSPSP